MTDDHGAAPVSGLSRHPLAPAPEAVAGADARRLAELFVGATRWGGWRVQRAIVTRWEELRDGAIEWAGITGDRELLHALACLEMDTEIADFDATDARDLERIETAIDLFTRAGDTARALDLEHLLAVELDGDDVRGDMLLDRIRACGEARALITALSRSRIDGGDQDAVRDRLAELRALDVDVMSEPMTRMRMGWAILGLGPTFDGVLGLPDLVDAYLLDDEFPALRAAQARRRANLARRTGRGERAVAVLRAEADRQRSMGMTVELTRLMHRASEQLEDLGDPAGAESAIRQAVAAAHASGITKFEADARAGLAACLLNQGRTEEGAAAVDEALALLDAVDGPRHLIIGEDLIRARCALCDMGSRAHCGLGHRERAGGLAREAARTAERLGAHGRASVMWELLGEVMLPTDASASDRAFERAAGQARADQDGLRALRMTCRRAWAIAIRTGMQEAARMMEQAEGIAEQLRDTLAADPGLAGRSGVDGQMLVLGVKIEEARLVAASKAYENAIGWLVGLPEQAAEHGDLTLALDGFRLRARLHLQLDMEQGAFAALERCLDLTRRLGDEREHRRLLSEGRDWLEEHGRHEEAVRWGEDHRDDPGPWNDPSGNPAGGEAT